jgi:hypothetical protein
MIDGAEQEQTYEWKYTRKEELAPNEFSKQVLTTLQEKDVVSVGEQHDLEQDTSYSWLLDYQTDILDAYDKYSLSKDSSKPPPPLERLLRRESDLLERLAQEVPTFDQLRQMHVGRLFAVGVLPLAAVAGYKHVVFEGVDENDPQRNLARSKDKIGDLLRLTYAMQLGMNIHGAYSDGLMSTAADTGDALFAKIQEVKNADPEGKIIVYNGATHNMTEPFRKGMKVKEGLIEYDASELTYAPRAREKWGMKYGSIDLLNGNRSFPASHFKYMQEHAVADRITAFSHGIDQKSYVIK